MPLISIKGRVVSGMGKGRVFLALHAYQSKIRELAGFTPFAGTLNLQINENEWTHFREGLDKQTMETVTENGKKMGGFDLYKIRFAEDSGGAVIVPHQSTHPENIIEIVAPVSLREKFELNDNDLLQLKAG